MMMPMKLAAGGHSNHATSTRGSVYVCGGGTTIQERAWRSSPTKQTETLKVDDGPVRHQSNSLILKQEAAMDATPG